MTARDVVKNAYIEAGILMPSEDMSAPDADYGLNNCNRMFAGWSTRTPFIFTTRIDRYTMSPAQQSYTIGRDSADFDADRPLGQGPGHGITSANIILTAVSPEVRVPLRIIDDEEWAGIRVTNVGTSIPQMLYNDGGYPNSRLYLWGFPNDGNDLELFTEQQLTQLTSIDVDFEMPPGYEDATIYTLAERLCVAFKIPVTPELAEQARRARAAIQGINTAAPRISTNDAGMPGSSQYIQPYFNYRTGQ